MKKLLMLMVALVLTGCQYENSKPAVGQPPSESGETIYQPNGTIEGCRLYYVNPRYGQRFQLAICDKSNSASYDRACGKGCVDHVQDLTVYHDE